MIRSYHDDNPEEFELIREPDHIATVSKKMKAEFARYFDSLVAKAPASDMARQTARPSVMCARLLLAWRRSWKTVFLGSHTVSTPTPGRRFLDSSSRFRRAGIRNIPQAFWAGDLYAV